MNAPYSYEPWRVLYFVCGGESEEAYIQELNRFLKDSGIRCSLKLIGENNDKDDHQGSGENYHALKEKRKSRQIKPGEQCFFLIDNDQVYRGTLALKDIQSIDKKATILLNTHNFEDYLALHLPPERVQEWLTAFTHAGHFQNPLHSKAYMPLYKKIIPRYRKGRLPSGFDMAAGLRNLQTNWEQAAPRIMREQEREFAHFIIQQVLSLVKKKTP